MAGFSRELEREADRAGFDRMTAAGYDGHAGATVFERLSRELEVPRSSRVLLFADHPRVKERVASFNEFARAAPTATDNGRERFLEATRQARLDALELIWKRNDGVTLVFLLDTEQRLATLPPWCRFYLGDGYRLRNAAGDSELAIAQLEQATREAAEFSASWMRSVACTCARARTTRRCRRSSATSTWTHRGVMPATTAIHRPAAEGSHALKTAIRSRTRAAGGGDERLERHQGRRRRQGL